MEVFEEYRPQDIDAKVSLAGDMRDWSWFKIFVFTQKKIDLIKDLESSDNILLKHGGISYEKFSVCLDESNYPPELDKSHYPPEQSFGFVSRKKKNLSSLSFNFLVNLWTTVDKNGSMTWTVTKNKISILYYFNDETTDLENILSLLNTFARTYGLDSQSWKLSFTMQVSNSEH